MYKSLDTLQELSNKEHSLEEVLHKSGAVSDSDLMEKGICPDCYSTTTRVRYEQNSPDDYDEVFYCLGCGFTAS